MKRSGSGVRNLDSSTRINCAANVPTSRINGFMAAFGDSQSTRRESNVDFLIQMIGIKSSG